MENKKTYETRMESLSPLISEIVSAGGTVEITVTGNSMWPMLLHRKSKVKVARADNIKIGDTVEISYSGQTMLSYPPQVVAYSIKLAK